VKGLKGQIQLAHVGLAGVHPFRAASPIGVLLKFGLKPECRLREGVIYIMVVPLVLDKL